MTITKHRGLLVAALGFTACRSADALERTTGDVAASSPSVSAVGAGAKVPVAPNPALSATSAPDVEYSIVWGKAANRAAAESFLLEWRSQELKVLGKQLGQILAAGGGIYRWKQTSGKGEGMHDCDEAFNPGPQPNRKNRFVVDVKGAKAERLDAKGEIEIVGIATVEDVASFSNTVTLEASVGSYLFYSQAEDATYCTAAHNSSTYYANVYDLEKRALLKFPTKTDEQLLLLEARQLPKADQDRCGRAVKAAGSGGPLSTAGLSIESVVPRWTEERGLFFELGLATMSSYWMGKHSCTVSVSHVPPTLEPLAVPTALAALSKKLPGFTVGGWSTLRSTDGAAIAAARRFFRTRP